MHRACLLAILASCAGAEAMSLPATAPAGPEAQLGLHPGESMSFEVQLAGILVGEAQLAVGEIGLVDGRREIVIKSRAATAGAAAMIKNISDEATTVIDVETRRPVSIESVFDMGDKRALASTKIKGSVAEVTYIRSGDKRPQIVKVDFKTELLNDMHTAMAELRGWHAVPGTVRTVYVIGGKRLWRIDVKYVGEATIGSHVGNRRAVIYEGLSYRAKRDLSMESSKPARTFRVWLSDDADRVPLKVTATTELGDIVMDLIEYARP
ncbi:MAG: hypothetical protein H6Q90_244 [Deltaproteobacteria bacterium]|nr:hypothetical protein [Deltaproteobacteria bacterium]